jgi:hypothetical protein
MTLNSTLLASSDSISIVVLTAPEISRRFPYDRRADRNEAEKYRSRGHPHAASNVCAGISDYSNCQTLVRARNHGLHGWELYLRWDPVRGDDNFAALAAIITRPRHPRSESREEIGNSNGNRRAGAVAGILAKLCDLPGHYSVRS